MIGQLVLDFTAYWLFDIILGRLSYHAGSILIVGCSMGQLSVQPYRPAAHSRLQPGRAAPAWVAMLVGFVWLVAMVALLSIGVYRHFG